MFGYIYMIVNKVNGKTYVGQRKFHGKWNDDKYMGSGKILKQAINKEGVSNFEKFLIQYCSNQNELNKQEIFWIAEYRKRGKAEYNIANGGNTHPNTAGWKWYNNGVINRICWEYPGDDFKLGILTSNKGHLIWTDEERKKLSESCKGRTPWNKGKHNIYSEETKQKLRELRLGKSSHNKGVPMTPVSMMAIFEGGKYCFSASILQVWVDDEDGVEVVNLAPPANQAKRTTKSTKTEE